MNDANPSSRASDRPGTLQWLLIASIVALGIVAGALILRSEPGSSGADTHAHATQRGTDEHEHEGEAAHGGGAEQGAAHETHANEQKEHAEQQAARAPQPEHQAQAKDAHPPGRIALSDAQIGAAGITLEVAGPAVIRSALLLPGEIRFNEDRTAHVVPRVAGVVESVSADLGQQLKKGQVLAVLASAAVSEQRSELQAARRRLELARTTHEREKTLFDEKISPQQDVLQARQALREAEIAVANASQKLSALGASASSASLSRYELRAPFDGMVVEKHIALGEAVKDDANVFTVSDLSSVWAELNVAAKDLPQLHVGAKVLVRATAFDAEAPGVVSYVGALIGEQTRAARARVTLRNPGLIWRPGLFVNVELLADETNAPVTVAADAVQTQDGKPVVFVRVAGGFAPVAVETGRSDGHRIEIKSGLQAGATYAAAGSFVLKAEQGKGAATHTH